MISRLTGFRLPVSASRKRFVLLGSLALFALCGAAAAQSASAHGAAQSGPLAATTATSDTATISPRLLQIQAQIVPLSDRALASASAGGLPMPVASARTPDRPGVTLWDEIHIKPPAASTANGVVTITINGK